MIATDRRDDGTPMRTDGRKIAVVGAGVCGLSCAILLQEAGYDVTVFADRQTPDTTSDRAAAVFSPFRSIDDERVRRWTRASFKTFSQLAATADPSHGVSLAVMKEYFFERQAGPPWWSGLVEGFRRIEKPPPPYCDGVQAVMPRMDMTRYMPYLSARFLQGSCGCILTRHVSSFEDIWSLGFSHIVNCSGLGARRLASDPRVHPMRGQVLHVPNTLNLAEGMADSGRGATVTYIFPFDDHIVLGGTHEADEWREETNEAALDQILDRCRRMLRAHGHSDWSALGQSRIRAWAGLRPARSVGASHEAVRLERETLDDGRAVIHNYGHGRVGVTLSWGCAESVMQLIGET